MKLRITEKKLTEQESAREELRKKVYALDTKLREFAIKMQKKVPLEVAKAYFSFLPKGDRISKRDDLDKADKLEKYAQNGEVRIGDIFIIADEINNINPEMLKYFDQD